MQAWPAIAAIGAARNKSSGVFSGTDAGYAVARACLAYGAFARKRKLRIVDAADATTDTACRAPDFIKANEERLLTHQALPAVPMIQALADQVKRRYLASASLLVLNNEVPFSTRPLGRCRAAARQASSSPA